MADGPSLLEIRIQLVDGSTNRFLQSDPGKVRAIAESIQPHKLFDSPYLPLDATEGVIVFLTSQIVRMDFVFDTEMDWKFSKQDLEFRELTPEEFNSRYQPEADPALSRLQERKPGEPFHGFAHLNMAYGDDLYFEVTATVLPKLDQRMMMTTLLGGATIFFPRAGGGYSFLNLARVNRIDILPGQPDIAPNAWPVEWLSHDDDEVEPRTLKISRPE